MLMLSRKVGETMVVADHVFITVVAVKGDRVRLAVAGPKNVPVDRLEIHGLKKAQRRARQDQDPPGQLIP